MRGIQGRSAIVTRGASGLGRSIVLRLIDDGASVTVAAGVVNLTQYVAAMYGRHVVRCNAIAPGYMANPWTADREPPDQRDMARYERLLRDPATPDDVAAVAVFRASDAARAVTGQPYGVDAGRLAHEAAESVRMALQDLGAEE